MRNKLLSSLLSRVGDEISVRNPLKFLKDVDSDILVDSAASVLYLYTRVTRSSKRKSILFSEVICAIGHNIRGKLRLRKDSALAAKTGAFVLYSFELLGLIEVIKSAGANGHGTFVIELKNDEEIVKLWESLPGDKTEKLPSLTPYDDWAASKHQSGITIIKTKSKEVLESVTPKTHPMLFETLNRAQHIGWRINGDLLALANWALRNKADAFADIWEIQNAEAKQSKLREANAVSSIAKRFAGQIFYH